ncbi:MAG: elongation factor P--(R)-beta-lysine ligase [Spirochaetes bacterium]|nr:elongation factor P--(R)-beta-lysine ligase [Spirochaetota bacterium]
MTEIFFLRSRDKIIKKTRKYFSNLGYLEVETPVLSPFLIPESHLEVFGTKLVSPYTSDKEFFLTPSPEIWMKKLLAQGSGSIFQITKSFRNSEQTGKLHNPEFTMLEWYSVGANYADSIAITENLLKTLALRFKCNLLKPPCLKISVKELFLKHTGIDLEKFQNAESLAEAIRDAGFGDKSGYTWEEAFNYIFVSVIEPNLPAETPVFVIDYPLQIPCLAKKTACGKWFERWELYVNGIELANCYTEETSKAIADAFFKEQANRKKSSLVNHYVDNSYTDIFSESFPDCSGVALGMDRLVMAITGANKIQDVISFTF